MSYLLLYPAEELDLRARVRVLMTMIGAVGTLLGFGVEPLAAVAIALGGTAVGVEIARRLTSPYRALQLRVTVVIVIVVVVVNLVRLGYPVLTCGLVLAGAWCAAALAVRATGAVGHADQAA